jgi:leucyl-tRNA---protein transferase
MKPENAGLEVIVIPLEHQDHPCPYIPDQSARMEQAFLVDLDEWGLEELLKLGYRHFGRILFRPDCSHCGRCVPVRIDLSEYVLSRSRKRTLKRLLSSGLTFSLEEPVPDRALHTLYLEHKKRFTLPFKENFEEEDYNAFVNSFFYQTPGAMVLKIYDGVKTVAVSHLDFAGETCSAVYCYWDASYRHFSPGQCAIIKEILLARELGFRYLCLGYLIEENQAMKYKKSYIPLQASRKPGLWEKWLDKSGNIEEGMPEHPRFHIL